ncbi:LPS-assembly protein LptD [Lysobacter sp. N42]|uniref:LPS-assembly protein LptD n=1 Tax=Lysobacter sp. N42 TaxID=2545719 RepID=UPI0014046610|nr:LPS assembly protein LptD [Lysobacter sp. N42]
MSNQEPQSSSSLFTQQCSADPDWLPSDEVFNGESQPGSVDVWADYAEITGNRNALYSGNVAFRQENQWLLTESAEVDQFTGEIKAFDGIRYGDGYIAIRAEEITADMERQNAHVGAAEYVMLRNSAHGRAESIDIDAQAGQRSVRLGGSSFTTCPGENPAWQIIAQDIEMNEQESWGTARNAQFRVFNIPLLYIPKFTFPLTDERKTGLLYPTVKSTSRNGIEVETPWYINLAPNEDLTITPRYMSERGLMMMTEYRTLDETTSNQFNIEYLSSDKKQDDRADRYAFRLESFTEFNDEFTGYIEVMEVSDSGYINDFTSEFANRADAHLYRRAQLNYKAENIEAQFQIEDFQMLGPYTSPYRTVPRISYMQTMPFANHTEVSLFSEFTHFRNSENADDYATRLHLEPKLSFAWQRPGWDVESDLSYYLTHYEQSNDLSGRDRSITRGLPQLRARARIHLERSLDESGRMQTLSPQIQYLYVPYEDQSEIGIYDTILIQDDYYSLFRPRRFAGLDRIADAHQVTLGASTSYFADTGQELLRFSLGQIFYLDESQTQLFDESSRITASNSELSGELDFRVSDNWYFSSAIQYDTTLELARKARLAAEYRKDSENLVQFNYRRVRGLTEANQQVEQVGVVSAWRLNQDWVLASHLYQDIREGTTMDALLALQYESCCWSLRLSAYRRINRRFDITVPGDNVPDARFDNGLSLQFMLTGLGGGGGIINMLQQSIFGYRRPFYLND